MAKKIELNQEELAVKEQMDVLVEEVQDLEKQKEELKAIAKARMDRIKMQLDEAVKSLDENIVYKMGSLKGLFDRVPHSSTKTQDKVALLSGDVVLKKASRKLEYDKEALLQAAQQQQALYADLTNQKNRIIAAMETQTEEEAAGGVLGEELQAIEMQLNMADFSLIPYVHTKTVDSFGWSEYKDSLFVSEEGEIINKLTGEVVNNESLKVVEVPEELILK